MLSPGYRAQLLAGGAHPTPGDLAPEEVTPGAEAPQRSPSMGESIAVSVISGVTVAVVLVVVNRMFGLRADAAG